MGPELHRRHEGRVDVDDARAFHSGKIFGPDTPDSEHPAVLPLSAPPNQHRYDQERHGPKPRVVFRRPIAGQYDLYVRLNRDMSDDRWRTILATSHIGGDAMTEPSWWNRCIERMTNPRGRLA